MSDDQAFRYVLLAILLLALPIGMYHRIRSQATGEPLDRRKEGLFILASLRPVALVFFVGFVTYLISPASMAWASVRLPLGLRWTGVGSCALGVVLQMWTFRRLGKNLTDTVVTRRDHTLVTLGPYQWVRHPFYVAGALLLLGLSLAAANWFLLVSGAAAIALIVIRTRTEEEQLVVRFGDSYREYMKRTGRFLPRLGTRRP